MLNKIMKNKFYFTEFKRLVFLEAILYLQMLLRPVVLEFDVFWFVDDNRTCFIFPLPVSGKCQLARAQEARSAQWMSRDA